MSVLAETLACVHLINEFQEYTNVGLGRYMIWNKRREPLGFKTQHWGTVVVFESADFFMDQTYFSVCSYVIIKDM